MKKILILLLLAGNLCQPAYGFSLNSVNSLFSTIKDSISSYSSPLLETLNEHKTIKYGLAIAVAANLFYVWAMENVRKGKSRKSFIIRKMRPNNK